MDLEYEWFKKKIKEIAGVDLESYRAEQTKRLIDRALEESGARNYVKYIKYLQESPARIQAFKDSMTINVSHLFRDKPRWTELNRFLPSLIKGALKRNAGKDSSGPDVSVWSAGCSIGAEAYTLAIILEEIKRGNGFPNFSHRILCTDLDRTILQRAREGLFLDSHMKEVETRLLKNYFTIVNNPTAQWAQRYPTSTFYQVVDALKNNMEFRLHNLLESKWEKGFDLIACRNVIIYFTPEAKKQVFDRFSEALNPEGILFIGATETIFNPMDHGLDIVAPGTYKKVK